MATHPPPSWSPFSAERSLWLHHRCCSGLGSGNRDQYAYIARAFSGLLLRGEMNVTT